MASVAPSPQAARAFAGSHLFQNQPGQLQRQWSGLKLLRAMQQARNTETSLSAEELFETFLRSRQYKSDFVSKASDILWKKEVFDVDEEKLNQVRARLAELQKLKEEDDSAGYLKLSQAKQWGLGVYGAPNNVKVETTDIHNLEDDRRRVGLLEYEAVRLIPSQQTDNT